MVEDNMDIFYVYHLQHYLEPWLVGLNKRSKSVLRNGSHYQVINSSLEYLLSTPGSVAVGTSQITSDVPMLLYASGFGIRDVHT